MYGGNVAMGGLPLPYPLVTDILAQQRQSWQDYITAQILEAIEYLNRVGERSYPDKDN